MKACGLNELAEMLFAQADEIKKLQSDVDAKAKECEDSRGQEEVGTEEVGRN